MLLVTCSYGQGIKGTYAIKNVATGMLLRPLDANNKNETPIVAYSPTNWKCMTWDFNLVEGNTYYLRNLLTSKTFRPGKGAITEGVALEQQPLNETDKLQQWEFLPVGKTTNSRNPAGQELHSCSCGSLPRKSCVCGTGRKFYEGLLWRKP